MNVHQALAALQHAFPRLHIASALPITQGRDNFVLEINHDLIFRFPREEAVVPQLLREIKLMPLLASRLASPVPRFSSIWFPDQQYPYPFVGYHKLKGTWLSDPGLLPHTQKKLLPAIAHFLAELHRIPLGEAQTCEARGGTVPFWVQLYQRRFEQIQSIVLPLLPLAAQKQARHQWESYLARHAGLPFSPALIHRDLWLHHVLCDPEQGTLTGVIDWGEAAIGDPALDYIGFYRNWGREMVEEMRSLTHVDPDSTFWQRFDFYVEFYFQFYPPYTEAFKAVGSEDQRAFTHHLQRILSTLEG